jgi:hypothetical protein
VPLCVLAAVSEIRLLLLDNPTCHPKPVASPPPEMVPSLAVVQYPWPVAVMVMLTMGAGVLRGGVLQGWASPKVEIPPSPSTRV